MKLFNTLSLVILLVFTSCISDCIDSHECTNSMFINLKGNLKDYNKTRVYADKFENLDQMGVFVLRSGSTITDERYLDNILYTYNSESNFSTLESVYFPSDNSNVDIYSYYPYNPNGIDENDSKLKVSIHKDQSDKASYSASDFLLAKKLNVVPTTEAVELVYEHGLSKINLILSFSEGVEMNEALSNNPSVTFVHFPTSCYYDLLDDKYLTFSDFDNLTPHGSWILDGKTLVGKSLILLPNSPQLHDSSISLSYNGTEYIVNMPSDLKIKKGFQTDLEIHINPIAKTSELKIRGDISAWKNGDKVIAHSSKVNNYIDLSTIDFGKSNVHTIYSNNQAVGQICKEYISVKQPSQSFQAITYYPIEGNNKPNLTKGKVIQVLNNNSKIHFGNISWDNNNQAKYVAGDKQMNNKLYVTTTRELVYTPQKVSDLLSIRTAPYVVNDFRMQDIYSYPIVKVGTQYWLREDIKSEYSVVKSDVMGTDDSKTYIKTSIGSYVYSKRAVESLLIIPNTCRLPEKKDWKQLSDYLNEDASKMKTGQWVTYDGSPVQKSTNDSFWGATSSVVYHNDQFSSVYLSTLYATLDNRGYLDTHNTILLTAYSNLIINNIKDADKKKVMYTVRCMLK